MIARIIKKIAPSIGAAVVMEPEWGRVGQIVFSNGRIHYFRGANLGLNPLGSCEISKDKGYATFFMKRLGYSTIEGETFFSDSWAKAIKSDRDLHAAYDYAQKLAFPVIVKPNSGSQGVGVCKAWNKEQFYRALGQIFKHDRVAIVQRPVAGKDYRLVVIDNEVISAYQRLPLSVVGDGKLAISELLVVKQAEFKKNGRDTILEKDDSRIHEKLAEQGLTISDIPLSGEKIFLLDNANLSTGGDAIDVTASVSEYFRDIAVRLTHDMGLRLCGVDLMVNGDISDDSAEHWVLEINAAPGLDHYVTYGKEQEKIVDNLYAKVLKAMENS